MLFHIKADISFQHVQVIDAYAYIANVENEYRSVITTCQSRELSGDNGEFDPKKEKKWVGNIGQRCVTRQLVCTIQSYYRFQHYILESMLTLWTKLQIQFQVFVPFLSWGCHWSLLVLNKRRKEVQILNSLASVRQFRNEEMETTLVTSPCQYNKGLAHMPSFITVPTWLINGIAIGGVLTSMYWVCRRGWLGTIYFLSILLNGPNIITLTYPNKRRGTT